MNRITITMAVAAILLLFFMGCDKYHRNRYVGDWDFVTEIIHMQYLNDWKEVGRDTIYYSGKIEIYKQGLTIQYTENDIAMVSIYAKSARIYSTNGLGNSKGGTSGCFEGKDRMYLDLCWFPNGIIHRITGIKKSKK